MGNKGDLGDSRRKVSFDEAVRLAQKLKLAAVFETSAKVGESDSTTVEDVFFRCVLNSFD